MRAGTRERREVRKEREKKRVKWQCVVSVFVNQRTSRQSMLGWLSVFLTSFRFFLSWGECFMKKMPYSVAIGK